MSYSLSGGHIPQLRFGWQQSSYHIQHLYINTCTTCALRLLLCPAGKIWNNYHNARECTLLVFIVEQRILTRNLKEW